MSSYIYEVSLSETDVLGSGCTVSDIEYVHDEKQAFRLMKETGKNRLVRISITPDGKRIRETYLYAGCWEKSI